jgi:hypothetical protein
MLVLPWSGISQASIKDGEGCEGREALSMLIHPPLAARSSWICKRGKASRPKKMYASMGLQGPCTKYTFTKIPKGIGRFGVISERGICICTFRCRCKCRCRCICLVSVSAGISVCRNCRCQCIAPFLRAIPGNLYCHDLQMDVYIKCLLCQSQLPAVLRVRVGPSR